MRPNALAAALSPRKSPLQARSAATVETILEAATRVIAKESLSGFNTNRVAEVAGVSVGSLYQYFPNKTALVIALIQQDHFQLAARLMRCVDQYIEKTFDVALDALIDVALAHQFASPILAAALDHEERRLPLDDVLQQAQSELVQSIQHLLDAHADHIDPVSPKDAAYDCLVLVRALVDASQGSDDVALVKRRVQRAVSGYLGHAGSKRVR